MMKNILCMVCFLFAASITYAQPKQKTPVQKPLPELPKFLTASGLPYKMLNHTVAVIPYEGENLASYEVVVQKISDLYIVYTNLTEALPGKIDETKYKYLLQKNDEFDLIKIGMSEADNAVYVRADIFKAATTATLLTWIIKQVANFTNIAAGDLK